MTRIVVCAVALAAVLGCKRENPIEQAAPSSTEAKTSCSYTYDSAQTKLTWTAYKLTERVGVSGTFNKITAQGAKPAATPVGVFPGLTFLIDTSSVNSDNPERDPKLVASFFGKLPEGESISGTVKSIEDKKAVVDLSLGGVQKEVPFEVVVDGSTLTATASIDLNDFQGQAAVDSLNAACKELHTGTDGASKLWPDVGLKIESTLKKTCN
ncbi:MAG: YceI family protein [Polyangiales bacterium]